MLQDELVEIDRGFWLEGEDYFRAHVDERCVLIFAQMQGVYPRKEVAASAHDPKRWRDLEIGSAFAHQPMDDLAVLGYEARVTRGDGQPYRAWIGSTYVRRDGAWKLTAHQHTPVTD